MTPKKTNRIIDVDSLPTLPSVAIEAIRLMEGEDSSFESIADLLKNDQVLTGRILHYANSAYVGAQRKITSNAQAISLLGFNSVRSIILSVSIFDCFKGQFSEHRDKLVNFWLHSIGVAVTAEALAEKLGFPSPEEAYIAGLLHDLGKLAIYIQFPSEFEEICLEIDRKGAYALQGNLPLDIEYAKLGFNHIDAGKQIADCWRIPESLGKVMWLHHQPVFETIEPETANLSKLIRFADVLCVTHNIGSSYFLASGTQCHEHFHYALENLLLHHHFTSNDLLEIIEEVSGKVKDVGSVLGFWDEDEYRKLISSANVSLGRMSMYLEKNNRQLEEMNLVCGATCEMTRRLKPGVSLEAAAEVVVDSVIKAFGVERCLCMLRDPEACAYVGRFSDGRKMHTLNIPAHLSEMKKKFSGRGKISEIESEAIERLEQTAIDLSKGAILESGVINMVAGSNFLATFFVSDNKSGMSEDHIFGELIVDFSEDLDIRGSSLESLKTNFETIALAAGNAIERLILEKDLTRQTQEMAATSRKMEESQHQLFHSHRLATVGRLAAGAAHEINNPLTIISLNIQILERMLAKQKDEQPEIVDRLKIISEQEERISKIIQDLMGYARPTEPQFCQASVGNIINKVLSVIGDRVSMKDVKVENQIPEDMAMVMVDPLQIEQVFMNLMINANHAMPAGGKIILSAEINDGLVNVIVADTGEGISKENLGKIFDPFFTTKKEGEGTGLGLAICHSIVEHNGGYMRVKSEVGVGTTFIIALPVDKSSRLQKMKRALGRKDSDATAVPEKCRILVIDDERFINDMLQENLKSVGYEVDGAYDGVEGIGLLRFKRYHLVLLDIRMPRKDGLEVLKFVTEEFPDLKVVIITGLASKEEVAETVRHGAYACLKKPFKLERVLETVSAALKDVCSTYMDE
ncbi:MAG: HDOD domain-containing protein [Proteobacteria bacterium]|nr:HDOD domain-containing protein [Pseudomonadota bacterium]MBU1710594.1 HDOD domain-containing protein [Pseudomonadota bacterium]